MNNLSDDELLFELFAHRIQFLDYSTDEYFIIRKLKLKLLEMGYPVEDLNNIVYTFYSYFNILITMNEIENVSINQQTNGSNFLQQLLVSMNNVPNNFSNNFSNSFSNITPIPIQTPMQMPLIIEQNEDEEVDNYDDMPPLAEVNNMFDSYNPLDNNTQSIINVTNLLNIILGNPDTFIFEQMLVAPPNIAQNRQFMQDIVVTTDENTLNTLNILKITKDMNENCTICMEEMNEDEEYFDIKCKHIFHKNCLETYLKNYNHICPVCRNEIGESVPHLN